MTRAQETRRAGNFGELQHDGQAVEMERGSVQSHASDYTTLPNGRRVTRRDVLAYEAAQRLMRENAHIFNALVAHLRREAEAGRHIGADEASAFLRGHDFTDNEGGEFKLNHDYVPVWMREVRKACPDLAPRIKLRKSRFDAFYAE